MSPKIKKERYINVDAERVKEVAEKKNVRMKDMADAIGTVYPNFQRQLKKGEIQKDWLSIICDLLNISEKYLTGESERKYRRGTDFNKIDEQKKALSNLLRFSRHTVEDIEKINILSIRDIEKIINLIDLKLDYPDIFEDVYKFYNDYMCNLENQ